MAAGARTSTAAPLSGPSGAADDATMRRGERLVAEFRSRMTLRPARGFVFSDRDVRNASTRSVKLRALHWEATVVPGAWIGAYFVELFCWATPPWKMDYKS